MKQINVLKTVEADQTLPSVQLSDINAIADIPNWLTYIDASITDQKKILNRASGNETENTSVSNAYPVVVEENGNKWFSFNRTTGYVFPADVGFDPAKGVTVFGVVKPEPIGVDGRGSIVTTNSIFSNAGESGINLAFNLNTVDRIFSSRNAGGSNGTSSSTLYQEGAFANKAGLYLATFHPTRGAKLYIDGVLVQEKSSMVPINKEFGAGEYQWMHQFKGLVGCVGMINSDLSEKPEDLTKLQTFLKTKYGIA